MLNITQSAKKSKVPKGRTLTIRHYKEYNHMGQKRVREDSDR